MTDETIFAAALEKPTPADRAAYLDHACAEDPEQRRRVEALVVAYHRADGFMERPAIAPEAAPPTQTFGGTPHGTAHADADVLVLLGPSSGPDSLGRLQHYEVFEILGRGGFGIVLRAFDEKLHRIVAIKLLDPRLATSGSARQRFIREARAAASVRHENVVDVHAVDDQGQVPFLVMEYVAGKTLQDKIDAAGPLPVEEVLRIGAQTAAGLAAAHAQGKIHRDVKPGNILLENSIERVKLTDFGLARAVDDASLTQSGVIAGTPLYMSPEQARGDAIDHRSDLFSLGSVFYTMCAGRPPFRAASSNAVLKRVVEDDPRPLPEVNSRIPAWLAEIVTRLHAKDPADRFQTAGEVAELLTRYLSEYQLRGSVSRAHVGLRRSVWWAVCACATVAIGVALYVRDRSASLHAALFGPSVEAVPLGLDATAPPPGASTSLAVLPFDADRAKTLQEEEAARLGLPVEFTNTVGMRLRVIPSGRFEMGSSKEQIAEEQREASGRSGRANASYLDLILMEGPRHEVTLSHPFAMGVTEVTVGQFRRFVEESEYVTLCERDGLGGIGLSGDGERRQGPEFNWRNTGEEQQDDHPVSQVAWDDAESFCRWLSRKEGRNYRLPTEAEWEWACRAGTDGRYPWGAWTRTRAERFANVSQPAQTRTRQPVAQRAANAFGLYDMCGNIQEWCRDFYGEYGSEATVDPTGPPTGEFRVTRGGHVFEETFRKPGSAYRNFGRKAAGFRVVLDLVALTTGDTASTSPVIPSEATPEAGQEAPPPTDAN